MKPLEGSTRLRAHAGGWTVQPRLRITIFIEHDIVYRHFVQSRVFSALASTHDVTFVFPKQGSGNKRFSINIDAGQLGAPYELIGLDQERLFQWRRLFQVSQLVWRPGPEWKHLRRVTRYLIGPRASKLYGVLGLPGIFPLFRWWSERQIERVSSSVEAVLDRLRPDVIMHPTVLDGYFINDLVLLGRRRAIPTIAIMNSWDNPSTKRAVVGQPDWLLVWGPQTKAHAVTYTGMRPERAVAFGAAQFDIYRQPARVGREGFCERHGIAPTKRLLLYAGSSKVTDEFAHLCSIDQAIEAGQLENLAVIYRPHPWGNGGYKGERLLEHPWRHIAIENSSRGYLESVRSGRKGIHLADYADTHDVLSCVDEIGRAHV
jgi:hypothetical protein